MYLLQSRIDQSGLMAAMSLTVAAAAVATIWSPSRKARPLMEERAAGQRPSRIALISSVQISSPSPRTMTSTHGASLSTCLYMKVACTPPRTRTAFGTVSAAMRSTSSAL